MYHRIEIAVKPHIEDGRVHALLEMIREDASLSPLDANIIDVYNIFGDYSANEIETLKTELFLDPVCQYAETGFTLASSISADFLIEVAYKPGVTDNVGRTAARGISEIMKKPVDSSSVRSSKLYLFKGSFSQEEMNRMAEKALCNTLIEDYTILTAADIAKGKKISYTLPDEAPITPPYFNSINLEVPDSELDSISEKGLLFLTLEEMKVIRDYYRNPGVIKLRKSLNLPSAPTDVELEVLAQTWSEHCKHKIFSANITYNEGTHTKTIKSLFKKYIKGATDEIGKVRKDLLSLFKDNAGVVKYNDDLAYCVKVETHNSPSALDPYGGAMTGIVGVNRDIIGTGMGAYPIFNTDIFCFGSPFTETEKIPRGLQHPKRIFRGVHRGIKDGGNESGIPTVNGSITFDDSFIGKPLVFCGTGGIMPLKLGKRDAFEKYVTKGDLIVMCGGRIGKDGIHGATFSSAHLSETSPTSAVQIGDPITQKKMLDFLMEARDLELYNGLTDNGAGGLSSSVGEMAQFTGGAELFLERCPLKYNGLKPWEILVSEAQERMTVAVPPSKIEAFLALSKKRDVESTVIGSFTDSRYFTCSYKDEIVCSLELDFMHEGLPPMQLNATWKPPGQSRIKVDKPDFNNALTTILTRPNIASKEYWVRMYDHEVGGRTVGKPFTGKDNDGPADGGLLRMSPESTEGLAVTHGIVPRYSLLDSYQMAACAIDEAVRQAVCLGADPDSLVGLDNFCWPDPVESGHTPDGQYKLAQLVRACEAVYDTTIAYNCPCISGKDSMKNDYKGANSKISVLPTLLFTCVGKVADVTRHISFYFKKPHDKIFLLGETGPHLGASEYAQMRQLEGGLVPTVNTKKATLLYKHLALALEKGILASCHDLSDGGLVVALAESAFSGNLGASVTLDNIPGDLSSAEKLFSESPSRILVSLDPQNEDAFIELFRNVPHFYLGTVLETPALTVHEAGKTLISQDLTTLKKLWKESLIF